MRSQSLLRIGPAVLAILASALLCGGLSWAQSRPASAPTSLPAASRPAASRPTARRPAASRPDSTQSSRPASQPGTAASTQASSQDHDEPPVEIMKSLRDSFVVVEVWYKKDTTEAAGDVSGAGQRIYSDYVDQKTPEEKTGVVLDDQGRVLIVEDGVEDRFIDRIVVRTAAGEAFPAQRSRLLYDAPGVVLKVDANAARRLRPLKFAPLAADSMNESFQQVSLHRIEDQWRLSAGRMSPSIEYGVKAPDNVFYGYRSSSRWGTTWRSPGVLCDSNGRPVGVALTSFFDLKQREGIWKGADLLAAKGIDWAELRKLEETQRAAATACVQEVLLRLRGRGEDEESIYGVAINSTDVLVLQGLSETAAAMLDKVSIKFSPTKRAEANFVGAYKKFGGFVVRLAKEKLPAFILLSEANDPPRMRPFWEATVRKRFGNKYVDLASNRITGRVQGFENVYHWDADRSMSGGTILMGFDGRVIGLNVHERRENEEESRLESGSSSYSSYGSSSYSSYGSRGSSYGSSYTPSYLSHRDTSSWRIFTMGEVRESLAKVTDFDPKIIVKSRTEAKRRAWLGVEFVGMSSDLAEQFKAEQATKDGQLGLVVNAVYPGSPAQKQGLQVGDILLKVQVPGRPYPIELSSSNAGGSSRYYGGFYSGRRRFGGDDEDTQPWKSRSNFLTQAFDTIGVGKTVQITYFRPDEKTGQGKLTTFDYKIEQAPIDFDSAAKWKNRKLGLTVKDLTYEIRYALNLKESDAGLVVADVEEGSPMMVARVYPNEILTRMDDQPLTSARQMHDLIVQAVKAGKTKVHLAVLRLGKTRFADLAIGEYDAAEDEGLNED